MKIGTFRTSYTQNLLKFFFTIYIYYKNFKLFSKDEGTETNKAQKDFELFFDDKSRRDLLIQQWYYRLLPAIEKHMFIYNDEFRIYENIIDEAVKQSDDLYYGYD